MPDITPYKDQLLQTVDQLFEMRNELFTQVINLAMAGEMKDVDEAFEEGDEYRFELDSFEDSGDANVNALVELVRTIQATHDTICNLNNIGFDRDEQRYYFK